jgi:hypothetical protein
MTNSDDVEGSDNMPPFPSVNKEKIQKLSTRTTSFQIQNQNLDVANVKQKSQPLICEIR